MKLEINMNAVIVLGTAQLDSSATSADWIRLVCAKVAKIFHQMDSLQARAISITTEDTVRGDVKKVTTSIEEEYVIDALIKRVQRISTELAIVMIRMEINFRVLLVRRRALPDNIDETARVPHLERALSVLMLLHLRITQVKAK